jgi:hypothetical protein
MIRSSGAAAGWEPPEPVLWLDTGPSDRDAVEPTAAALLYIMLIPVDQP